METTPCALLPRPELRGESYLHVPLRLEGGEDEHEGETEDDHVNGRAVERELHGASLRVSYTTNKQRFDTVVRRARGD